MPAVGLAPDSAPPGAGDANERALARTRRLLLALSIRREEDYRLAVLKRVAKRLGEEGYPEFLRLLLIVANSHDARAKKIVAATLAVALRRMDLPSGRLSSWGASRLAQSSAPVTATELTGYFFGGAPKRRLGPIEYVTVWYRQRTQRITLGRDAFIFALSQLIELINQSPDARELYIRRLQAESDQEIEGAYTTASRKVLQRIAQQWQAGIDAQQIAVGAAGESPGASTNDAPASDWVIRTL